MVANATVSMLMWQLVASGQPRVTSLSPLARSTGMATVRQASQLLVGASVAVLGAPAPTATDTVRGWTGAGSAA